MKTKAVVREFFDENVEEWDTHRYQDATYVSRGRVAVRWLKQIRPGKRILDMGCGTGHQALALLRYGHEVVAADFSEPMARATRDRIVRELPDQPPLVIVADALNPPFRDQSFDGVMALGVIGFLGDRVKGLRSIHDILRPEGTLICDAGVPEEHVLFQIISGKLTGFFEVLLRLEPLPRRPGWYSQNFIKHTPRVFERMLEGSGFKPVARGGGGFGDLMVRGRSILPWRVQRHLASVLSELSTHALGTPLARHALTYVVRSTK